MDYLYYGIIFIMMVLFLFRLTNNLCLHLLNWKIVDNIKVKKVIANNPKVIVTILHTSIWDGFLTVFICCALQIHVNNIVKYKFMQIINLVFPYYHTIILQNSNTPAIIKYVNNTEHFILAIAPEGSRRYVERWRSGWYHIARGTDAVVIPIGFDYQSKTIYLNKVMRVTDNYEHDLQVMQEELKQYPPCYPEACSLFGKKE